MEEGELGAEAAPVAQTSEQLERGEPTGIAELRAVAGVAIPHGGGCSATYIGDRVILLAAHCVAPFGSGCAGSTQPPENVFALFADQDGDPTGADAQRIRLLGFAVHPNAWSDRVTSCPDPVPPLAACPADVSGLGPSCNLVERCQWDPMRSMSPGFHLEHDIALGYLESAPVGIDPLPVIIGSKPMLGPTGMHFFPGLIAFLDTHPIVTLAGYGGGSTNWCPPGQPWCGGRDYGTAHLTARMFAAGRWDQCDGTRGPVEDVPMLTVQVQDHRNAYTRGGDSGGPLLLGPGEVGAMEIPSLLPPSSGLVPRRYVAGVASVGYDIAVPGSVCAGPAGCAPTDDCVFDAQGNGQCVTRCVAQVDCPANAACMPDPIAQGYCHSPHSVYATTYDSMNGLWLAAAFGDIDRDGVPNDIDNCISVPNPDQANCNLDAEIDRQGDVLGDACDPVPCPAATAPVSFEVPLVDASAGCVVLETSRMVRRDIDPDVLGSHNPFSGAEMADTQKRATPRYCVKGQFPPVTCRLQDGERRDVDFNAADESLSIWRWMTLPALGATGSSTTWDYPSNPAPLGWDYWADRERWLANSWMQSSEPQKPQHFPDFLWDGMSDIDGAIGIRAGLARSRDLLGNINHPANGIHHTPDLGDGYQTGEGLGRAYIDMAPDTIVIRHGSSCSQAEPCQGPLCNQGVLGTLRWCPQCTRSLEWWNAVLPVDSLLARATDGRLGVVDDKGRIIVVDEMLSPSLTDRLSNPDLLLVTAVEPYFDMGRGYRGVQGMFISADATFTDGAIVSTGGGFRMEREGLIDLLAMSQPAAATALDGMPARTGFAAVLSRTIGALVVVGGSDTSTGQLSRDVWMVPQYGLPFQVEVPGYAPERVLAATVAPADGTLWILDELRMHGWLRVARLVRIDPSSGAHETVWQGPRLGIFDRHWLAADRDGQVLLFGSSSALRKHVTVRFEMEPYVMGTSRPVLARFWRGELLGAPLVDQAGYQFVTAKGAKKLRSERIESLDQRPGIVVDLSRCL